MLGCGPPRNWATLAQPKSSRARAVITQIDVCGAYIGLAFDDGRVELWAWFGDLVFGGLLVAVAGPISAGTYPPAQEPLEFALAALVGASFGTAVVGFRLYLGWSYVSSRLLSASVEYEETGWYDGQVWVKPPEILARDRLLESFEVRPALRRLKGALLATGLGLVACASGLAGVTGGGSA